MSLFILDTHVWLWWLHDEKKISPRHRKVIEQAEYADGLRVSAISVWEVGTKVSLGKLELPLALADWYSAATTYPGIAVLPVDAEDALESTILPGNFHKDPADRLIVAMTRRRNATLITYDKKILGYHHIRTLK